MSIQLDYISCYKSIRLYISYFHFLLNHRRYAGIPDFLTAEDMAAMVRDNRVDPKMVFSYVQEVYRMCNEM